MIEVVDQANGQQHRTRLTTGTRELSWWSMAASPAKLLNTKEPIDPRAFVGAFMSLANECDRSIRETELNLARGSDLCSRLLTMRLAVSFIDTAAAQIVIPYGNFDNDFEKYLVVTITLAALAFAMWRYFSNR